jgi:hypothetical protein
VSPLIARIDVVVQWPDLGPEDLNVVEDVLDETPSYDVERRERLTDLLKRMTRMLLTAKTQPSE